MSITEKIREAKQNKAEEVRIAEDKERKQREVEKDKDNTFDKYKKRASNYCNNMARSLGIYESIGIIGKEIGKSESKNYYSDPFAYHYYIGKEFQIFDRQTDDQVIGVDVIHQMRKYGMNATTKEIKDIYSKEVRDFSIFYSFDRDKNIHHPIFRSGPIYIPEKFEIEVVDLGNNRFDLKNTSSDRKEYNFEKNNVSREELREISDTILANMYTEIQEDSFRLTPKKTIFQGIKKKIFGVQKF